MSTYTPDWEVRDIIVTALRADAALHMLLFPDWSPLVDPTVDLRVYDVHAELRPSPEVRNVLPRINVDTIWHPDAVPIEQRASNLRGAVGLWLYAIVPEARKAHGTMLAARAMHVVLSTPLSGARIIAADLYGTGTAPAERLSAFDGAWQFRSEFRSAEVEVLV